MKLISERKHIIEGETHQSKKALEAQQKELEDLELSVDKVITELAVAKVELHEAGEELIEAQHRLTMARKEFSDVKTAHEQTTIKHNAAAEARKQELATLEQTKHDLEHDISELIGEKTTFEEELEHTKKHLLTAETDLDAIVTEKERQITALEAKLLNLTQTIDQRSQEEELVRQDLATWQRRLEEKDTNLRVREQKVQMGEDKLISNSNLLNL